MVVAAMVALALLLKFANVVRRLFWLALRLVLAAAVAGMVGILFPMSLLTDDEQWLLILVPAAAALLTLWLTRDWGERFPVRPTRRLTVADPAGVASLPRASAEPPKAQRATLIDSSLADRLAGTKKALERAAQDELGAPAAEWLEFWRRRVPDLIAAAQGVFDNAAPLEQAGVAERLATDLADIIAEAERRLAVVQAARRDLFATRSAHAAQRVREG